MVLVGNSHKDWLRAYLSGCPATGLKGVCPLHPNCEMSHLYNPQERDTNADLFHNADLLLYRAKRDDQGNRTGHTMKLRMQLEDFLLRHNSSQHPVYTALYWREASYVWWEKLPSQKLFNFVFGFALGAGKGDSVYVYVCVCEW